MDLQPDISSALKLIAALLFVLGLMGALALVMKKLGLTGSMPLSKGGKRLRVLEVLALDARRRLVLLERDNIQHLVILGADSETLVETHIKPIENKPHDT